MPKIDLMQITAERSVDLDVLVVGTSLAEFGIDPRLLQSAVFPNSERPVLNGAIGGVSAIKGLDITERFDFRPRLVVISVSPMDFTDNAQSRGKRFERYAEFLIEGEVPEDDLRSRIEVAVAKIVRSICHASSPLRTRTWPDWLRFLRKSRHVDLLAFLNSPAVVEEECDTCWSGYIGATGPDEAPEASESRKEDHIAKDFTVENGPHLLGLAERVRQIGSEGTTVVLVRLPTLWWFRKVEDESAPDFVPLMRQLSRETGAPYFDDLVSVDFMTDGQNFVDVNHLSFRGSRFFTKVLAEQILFANLIRVGAQSDDVQADRAAEGVAVEPAF